MVNKLPTILVFAGPNGSGKSTITDLVEVIGEYVNADEIQKELRCSVLEAAQKATQKRKDLIAEHKDFTFETVLSSPINLELLNKAKSEGYFVKCFYVLTDNPAINVQRVAVRVSQGGHDVPEDKIYSRYKKALLQIPELISICDIIHIYDNTVKPVRIFKKRKNQKFYWETELWNKERIEKLIDDKLI